MLHEQDGEVVVVAAVAAAEEVAAVAGRRGTAVLNLAVAVVAVVRPVTSDHAARLWSVPFRSAVMRSARGGGASVAKAALSSITRTATSNQPCSRLRS